MCFGELKPWQHVFSKLAANSYSPCHSPPYITCLQVSAEKHLCQTRPFPAVPWCPPRPGSTSFISLGLPGRTFPGLSPCLSPSCPMMPVLDVSDKAICQHCKLLLGSRHLLFLVTISLFNCLIRYKSMPVILSEGARKKSTLEFTWWPMAPLSPQMANAGNKDTCTDKHDENEGIMQGGVRDALRGSSSGFLVSILMTSCKFYTLVEQIELWLMLQNLRSWLLGFLTVLSFFNK